MHLRGIGNVSGLLALPLALLYLLSPVAARAQSQGQSQGQASSASFAQAPATLAALRSQLSGLLAGWTGDYAVTVTDLQSDQSIDINGDRQQSSASTIKLAVLIAVARDIAQGVLSEASVNGLVDAMMGPSDNAASRQLIIDLGGGDVYAGIARVNDLFNSLGMTGSVLDSPPGYTEEDAGIANDNYLTTNDLNHLLSLLYTGKILPLAETSYVLQAMTLPDAWEDALGDPLPEDVTLYHKPGWLDAPDPTWNAAGIVTFQRNDRTYAYIVSVLGTHTDSESDAYQHVSSVSAAVWSYFDAAYPQLTAIYFPQTGQWLEHGFLLYWEQFGGLSIFGYPLTGEFKQDGVVVQYFERARFEWHPGADPSHFDVLLGLLGDEVTATQRAAGAAPFKAAGQSIGGCIYFQPTAHNLCNGFLAYWQEYGGLALFGYPISEEFQENGVTMQYFERARFEWHPGSNPAAYDVLLGRLGAQELAAQNH